MSAIAIASKAPRKLRGQALIDAYVALKSVEMRGKVWAFKEGRRICIRGDNLPVHPQHPMAKSMRGWSMLDYKTPTQCQEYLANQGCMGQSVAYEPQGSPLTH